MATDWTAAAGSKCALLCEDASSPLQDATSNNSDATVVGSPNYQQTGKYSTFGFGFDKTNGEYLNLNSPTALDNVSPISVTMWANNTDRGTAGTVTDGAILYNCGDYRSGVFGFQNTNQLRWYEHFAGGSISYDTTNGSVVNSAFQHYAVVFDNSGTSPTDIPDIYIDKVSQTVSASGSPFLTRDDDSASDKYIGQDSLGGGELNSVLDEILVYAGLLTSTDVAEIYDNGLDGTHGTATSTSYRLLLLGVG